MRTDVRASAEPWVWRHLIDRNAGCFMRNNMQMFAFSLMKEMCYGNKRS
jgi:hypothetical protein